MHFLVKRVITYVVILFVVLNFEFIVPGLAKEYGFECRRVVNHFPRPVIL